MSSDGSKSYKIEFWLFQLCSLAALLIMAAFSVMAAIVFIESQASDEEDENYIYGIISMIVFTIGTLYGLYMWFGHFRTSYKKMKGMTEMRRTMRMNSNRLTY